MMQCMANGNVLRIRRSLVDLQNEYDQGNKKPLEDVMRAWKGIKELPPDDPRSFFNLAGYHGEPFRGAGWGTSSYWGGYCNHGNVLFPTWHRVYLLKLEEALRSIEGCEDVALPFWDETIDEGAGPHDQPHNIPWALTDKEFVLDGETIPNPLRSFVFPQQITDNLSPIPDADYSKPKGYETVRYPLSGLVGTDADRAATQAHNQQFANDQQNVALLNQNVANWLNSSIVVDGKPVPTNVTAKYVSCLDAPNYTVFSNTTSATQWNDNLPAGAPAVVPLESPHNSIHLAVGGFELPNIFNVDAIPGANGDMGENDTAAFDPIFYFHHCFVDRVFWLWQKKHGCTDHLDVIDGYPGTNSVDNQGPTPGVAPNSWLDMSSPLNPFKKTEAGTQRPYASLDCFNIETQLGYTYGPGSLEKHAQQEVSLSEMIPEQAQAVRTVEVSGLNRASIPGSFVISTFATIDGVRQLVGSEAVLSRWNVQGCANCQTHLQVKSFAPLHGISAEAADRATFDVQVTTRQRTAGEAESFAAQAPSALRIRVK